MEFSVLMSVYAGENGTYFQQAVESVINQTVIPTEVVIVKDGVLTQELETVCNDLISRYPNYIRFISLEENVGLGEALCQGVLACKYELIARMDTDDIAKPDRFEKQLQVFLENEDIALCGGWIEEFSYVPEKVESIKKVPLTCSEIYNYCKKRNPFNHMTVMFRKKAVIDSGNYLKFHLLEDYYLWFRMIINGYKMMNIRDVLVVVRAGNDMIKRRGGISYFRNEKKLYDCFLEKGFINKAEYYLVLLERLIIRIMPSMFRNIVYYKLLR